MTSGEGRDTGELLAIIMHSKRPQNPSRIQHSTFASGSGVRGWPGARCSFRGGRGGSAPRLSLSPVIGGLAGEGKGLREHKGLHLQVSCS